MTRTYKYGVFAEMLRQALGDNGMTQADLAHEFGLQQQAVSKWVQGRTRPRPATLSRLARRFGWDESATLRAAAYLDGVEESPPTPAPPRRPISERVSDLEVKLAYQQRILEEIRARLRRDEESR